MNSLPAKIFYSETCEICTENYDQDKAQTKYSLLKCGHLFHEACSNPWLEKTSSCPKCKDRCFVALSSSPNAHLVDAAKTGSDYMKKQGKLIISVIIGLATLALFGKSMQYGANLLGPSIEEMDPATRFLFRLDEESLRRNEEMETFLAKTIGVLLAAWVVGAVIMSVRLGFKRYYEANTLPRAQILDSIPEKFKVKED